MKEGFRRFVRILWLGYLFLRRPQAAYSLMGLIRGPDFPRYGMYLKGLFTTRLRGFFFPPWIGGSVRNTPPVRSSVYDLHCGLRGLATEVQKGKRSRSDIEHYLEHAVFTTRVLLSLPLQTKDEKIELQALYELAHLLCGEPHLRRLTEGRLLGWFDEHFLRPPHDEK